MTALDAVTGIATIARGCVDTVPTTHAAGARIWLYDNFVGSDQIEYFSSETVNLQPLTVATKGTLDAALAPTLTVPIVNRQNKPYPPAAMSINGTRWDLVTKISGSMMVTWVQRNRLTQLDQLVDNTMGSVTPEAGTTYTITLMDASGTPFYTATGIAGTVWTWPTPDDTHDHIQFTLAAVRGGVSSYQSQAFPTTLRTGYGLGFGSNFGG